MDKKTYVNKYNKIYGFDFIVNSKNNENKFSINVHIDESNINKNKINNEEENNINGKNNNKKKII